MGEMLGADHTLAIDDLPRRREQVKTLQGEIALLRAGVAGLKGDLERIDGSRSWRWSHGIARALGRLGGRHYETDGAVTQALDRIAWLEACLAETVPPWDRPADADYSPHRPASFCIKIPAPNWEVAPAWGDLHLGEGLARELDRRGHPSLVQVRSEWDDLDGLEHDVVIVLRGRRPYLPKPRQLNVLWVISHPHTLPAAECDAYDLICVASKPFAEKLKEETSTPVVVLEQATDERRFFPEPRASLNHELVFIGNSRNVYRKVLRDLLPTTRDLAVYGRGWEGVIDARHLVAERVPNDQLRHVYSSANIVLSDHWEDMREEGFISNRVYDAVACGALVVSDRVDGIHEHFGDAVACYETREELHALIERLLNDPDERRARGGDRPRAAARLAHLRPPRRRAAQRDRDGAGPAVARPRAPTTLTGCGAGDAARRLAPRATAHNGRRCGSRCCCSGRSSTTRACGGRRSRSRTPDTR